MEQTKSILIVGRNDPNEAMRVAAGLTIFSHRPTVIFLVAVPETAENTDMAELLEFSDVEAKTTLVDEAFPHVTTEELAVAIVQADEIINF